MPRLTKADIQNSLLNGTAVAWTDASGKPASIQLTSAKQRRLLAFLLGTRTREVKGLPQSFIDGLAAAAIATGDPGAVNVQQTINPSVAGPWKITSIKIEGFGGVNLWGRPSFELELDQQSLLIEGPNGSGKSSLVAAIIWALTGERPRDQGDSDLEEARPVFDAAGRPAGSWPPVAAYPPDLPSIRSTPKVSVEIHFADPSGKTAELVRRFDGRNVTYQADPRLKIPTILLEAGLLMPARMPHLRLDEGRGRLTEAVQKLTGLDELIELGIFVQGLCHSSRDYLSYKKAEFAAAKTAFDLQIERAKTALKQVAVAVPDFKPADTSDREGPMAKFGKQLNDKAAELLATVSSDLAKNLDISASKVQQQIIVALAAAEEDLQNGLGGLGTWKLASSIASALTRERRAAVQQSLAEADAQILATVDFFNRQKNDTKFRLKAMGAHWHDEHVDGDVKDCPLCGDSLSSNPILRGELEALRSAGEAAMRSVADNANAITTAVREALPGELRNLLNSDVPSAIAGGIEADYRERFIDAVRHKDILVEFHSLAESALADIPADEESTATTRVAPIRELDALVLQLNKVDQLCRVAEWFEKNAGAWQEWWSGLAAGEVSQSRTLSTHLTHLRESFDLAEPYRIAADAMRVAWSEGRTATSIEAEQQKRAEIAEELVPLKQLGNFAEAQARNAINDLSSRIGEIQSATYIADRLRFKAASLDRKSGLTVRGQLGPDILIDATLVANTSWLRGLLWAFIYALREEAVGQLGTDLFPVLLLDDPQQTFDSEHRARWAEQVAQMQKATPGVQVLLTTHDEQFLSQLDLLGVVGRMAFISSAGEEYGHIAVLEGDRLEREWQGASAAKTPAAAKTYIAAVREYVEGILKIMLRGMDPAVPTDVLGSNRQRIADLHAKAIEPWNRTAFSNLVGDLAPGRKEIKWMEQSHHTTGIVLTMIEASDVEAHWRKSLRPDLERCFRIVRDHRALHGGLVALHAFPPSVELPDGHKPKLRQYSLPMLGTAAALSNGRVADGCVDLVFSTRGPQAELNDHFAFRLEAKTLEPVARQGDILLVRDHGKVTPLSLVVALHDAQLLARRLQIADNHADVAVLTASAINPRETAPPVVAKLVTLTMKKVVGVLYANGNSAMGSSGEIAEIGGEAALTAILGKASGLVEVSGHSAEPMALDKQFLIIGPQMSAGEASKHYDGCPIIAEAADGARYFKRLRVLPEGLFLESMEIGGDYPPILLSLDARSLGLMRAAWPVLGVLFEAS